MQNSLYLFHTRSTAEGFIYFRELSAAVEGGLEGKDWWCFHTVSHLRIATSLLYLFYHLFFIQLSLLFLLCFSCTFFFFLSSPLIFFCFTFIWLPTSTDYCTDIRKCVMCNFPLFLIIENLSGAPTWHFHKCQCFSAIVKHSWRHKMSASLLSHSLCELLTSGNVNEQTTIRVSKFLEGRKHSTLSPTRKI